MRHFLFFFLLVHQVYSQDIHIRINVVGYAPDDNKLALVMSNEAIENPATLINATNGRPIFKGMMLPISTHKWGSFEYQYLMDFTEVHSHGDYYIKVGASLSDIFSIGINSYSNYQEDLLAFMRQQRCGYNPYFDVVCHQGDGRIFYAPVPDSTYYDFSGGWHDAGDQLKYLITGSNATARMLVAYEIAPEKFGDLVDQFGYPYPNGIPDVLDEARWGLEWILKLHPQPKWLIHQIADDRDHRGFKFPHKDNADYGWGPNSYRAAYFANGRPQGLGKWKSESTGIANIAGRSAAALALGAKIWGKLSIDDSFSRRCHKAAKELYQMGKENEGFQQGNSYGSPYRYNEDTWADDMEWGAAELYKLTNNSLYLDDAIKYANIVRDQGWMAMDTMMHYQKYPFMNIGHYSLFEIAPKSVKDKIIGWYHNNIVNVIRRSETNAYQVGVPFLWCSNNLMVNFITQVLLYEKMTGDMRFHSSMLLHRDWLLGRNPWGTSMFTGIPKGSETPIDVHLPPRALLNKTPSGGLIDGPIYKSIYNSLSGLTLTEPDEFAKFQNEIVVYHDDIGDYSTNEPTMDGTADAILIFALWSKGYK